MKKATAPKAPAGSKVVDCGTGSRARSGAAEAGGRARPAGAAPEVSGLRVSGTDCGAARVAMRSWRRSTGCRLASGASRSSCSLGAYRCQAIAVGRGTAVSCVRGGGTDVSFVARRR